MGAILQGAMDLHSEASLQRAEDGRATCKWCNMVVLGAPWKHLSWTCSHINSQELKAIKGTQDLVPEAAEGMLVDPTFWLRGLPSLDFPDPLGMDFKPSGLALMAFSKTMRSMATSLM